MTRTMYGAACLALFAAFLTGCSDDNSRDTPNIPAPVNTGLPNSPATGAQVLRGRYLVTTAGCGDCHNRGETNPNDPNWLAGYIDSSSVNPSNGGVFAIGPDTIYARNITPDSATGIGTWTIQQVFNALRQGKDTEGHYLAPPMPWPEYQNLTDEDTWSIVAYLKSIKAVTNDVPENAGPGGGVVDTSVFYPTVPPALPAYPAANENENTTQTGPGLPNGPATRDQVLQGRYLVNAANDCNACHSPRGNNPADPYFMSGYTANTTINPQATGFFQIGPVGVYARNLTPDATGLGTLTDQQVYNSMHDGTDYREGGVLKPPMPWTALHNLTPADTWAIVAYLRSIKPVANTVPSDTVPPGFPGFNTVAIPLPTYPGTNEVP